MKNLILPFVVVMLFMLGSCGDDALTNAPQNNNEDLAYKLVHPNTVKIDFTGISGKFYKTWSPNGYPPGMSMIVDSAIRTIGLAEYIAHDTTLKTKYPNLSTPGGDTIQLINYENLKWSDQISSTFSTKSKTVIVVLDSSTKLIKYFSYKKYDSYSTSGGSQSSPTSSRTDASTSFILNTPVPYTIQNDSLIIILRGSEISTTLAKFIQGSSSGSSSGRPSRPDSQSESRSDYCKELLPIPDEAQIRIVLQNK